jgi:hypothetical protein
MTARREVIHGISATRASAILGMNEWKTPVLAWQEIMEKLKPGFNAERGFILPVQEDKAAFRWGHAFESAVIELAESAQGMSITDREVLARDNGNPPAFCYLDGMYNQEKTDFDRILHEGKTSFERAYRMKWGEPGTDRIPQAYQIQAQHSMMCSGADETIVSVLVFPKSPDEWEEMGWQIAYDQSREIYTIEREHEKTTEISYPQRWAEVLEEMGYFHQYQIAANKDAQKLLREAYNHFWETYVLTETPPEVNDYEDIRRLFPEPKGTLIVGDEIASIMREYKDIGKEIGKSGHLAKRQQQLKTQILKFAMDKTTVADDESVEKIVFRDESGNKVGQYDGKTFRA